MRSDSEIVFESRLREIFPELEPSDFILNDRKVLKPYELDVYIPKLSMAFEYQGPYHYDDSTTRMLDKWKRKQCKKLGIKLYQYPCFNGLKIEDIRKYIFCDRELREGFYWPIKNSKHKEGKNWSRIYPANRSVRRSGEFKEYELRLLSKIKKRSFN